MSPRVSSSKPQVTIYTKSIHVPIWPYVPLVQDSFSTYMVIRSPRPIIICTSNSITEYWMYYAWPKLSCSSGSQLAFSVHTGPCVSAIHYSCAMQVSTSTLQTFKEKLKPAILALHDCFWLVDPHDNWILGTLFENIRQRRCRKRAFCDIRKPLPQAFSKSTLKE